MTSEDQYVAELNRIVDGLHTYLPQIPGTIDGAASVAKTLMFWDQAYVERKRIEAHEGYRDLRAQTDTFLACCAEECGMVVTVKSLRQAADAFERIDFGTLIDDIDVANLLGDRSGWTSPNQQLYEAKIQPLESKVRELRTALTALIDAARRCDSTLQSYVVGGLVATAGLALALAGLALALATGWTGVGAVIGLVIAILSLVASLDSFFLLPDVTGEIRAQAAAVQLAAGEVNESAWPSPPKLSSGAW